MNIVLTPKDADFILRYIRIDLERLVKSDNEIIKCKNAYVERLKSKGVKEDSFEGVIAKSLLELSDEVMNTSETNKKDLEHCIELLTCGSEEENAAS